VRRLFAILVVALGANHLGVAAGSTVVARLLDVAALCLLALLLGPGAAAAAGDADDRFGILTAPLALVVVAVAGGVLGARRLGTGRLAPLWSRLPAPAAGAVRVVQAAVAGPAATPPLQLAAAAALTVASWLLEAGALWSAARAAGVDLTPAAAATATAVTIAFQGFQFTPGGLGLYETSLTGILVVLGVDPAAGLSLALTTHALKFAYSYVAGALCLGALAFADVLDRAGRSALPAAPAGHGTALRTARP
jgi:uncharacterized membrane protein YbhN (UPF0104 family)